MATTLHVDEGVAELSEQPAPAQSLPPTPSGLLGSWSVRQAAELAKVRAAATGAVHQHHSAGRDVESSAVRRLLLVLSELATNAIKYGGGAATVALHRAENAWLVDVHDSGVHQPPVLHAPDPRRAGQNGLLIIDRICTTWGWYHHRGGNDHEAEREPVKHVWALVPDQAGVPADS